MNVEIKLLDPRLKNGTWAMPGFATEGSAAIDVVACIEEEVLINPGEVKMIPLGIAVHMDNNKVAALLMPRSGLGTRQGVILGNTVGLIDSDFQGQIQAPVWNRNFVNGTGAPAQIRIQPGDRIAQLMFVPVIRPVFSVVDEFSVATERGEGGFGSTGIGITDPAAKVEGSSSHPQAEAIKKATSFTSEKKAATDMDRDELIMKIRTIHACEELKSSDATLEYFKRELGTFEQLKRILENTIKQRSMFYVEMHFREIVRGYSADAIGMFLATLENTPFIRSIYTRHYEPKPLQANW